MRGRYFDTDYQETLRLTRQLPDLDSARCAADSPQVIPSTEAPSSFADVQAIVSHVAHSALLRAWRSSDIYTHYPALKGITPLQLDKAIAEALA